MTCTSDHKGYPIVMFVRSVEALIGGTAKIKAQTNLDAARGNEFNSLHYTMPIEEAPRVGERLLVTVEPFPPMEDEVGWVKLDVPACGHPIAVDGGYAYCTRPKGHEPPCHWEATEADLTIKRLVVKDKDGKTLLEA